MLQLNEIREQVLKSFISKKLLEESIYPSLEKVCRILVEDYDGIDTNSSFLKDRLILKEGDPASMAHFAELSDNLEIDLETLIEFVDYVEDYMTKANISSMNKLKAIRQKSTELMSQAVSLLLGNKYVDQYSDSIVENFDNSDNIDLDKTNVFIDFENKFATIGTKDTNFLHSLVGKVSNISVSPISVGYLSASTTYGHDAGKLYDGTKVPFIYNIEMPSSYSGEVGINIKITLSEKIKLNRLFLEFDDITSNNVSIHAFVDGVLRSLSDRHQYSEYADIRFDSIETDFIILKITNSRIYGTSHSGGKIYKFSIREIQYGHQAFMNFGSLVTKELAAPKPFSVVSLFADEIVPEGGSIEYYMDWGDGNLLISPSGRGEIDLPEYLSVLIDSDKSISIEGIDLTKIHPYIYGQNFGTSASISDIENISLLNPKIIRNYKGFKNKHEGINSNTISCIMYLENDTTSFNFKNYPAYLNGVFKSETETLPQGYSTLVFNKNNGIDIYKSYLDSLGVHYGSHLSEYIPDESFFNMVENNDYTRFTFVNVDGLNIALVKRLLESDVIAYNDWDKEDMLYIINDISPLSIDSLPETIKLKAVLKSSGAKCPIINNFKIKLGHM